jgi:phage-related protein
MMTFPKLKTNAVAQYPAQRSVRFQNQTLRFLDGTEQRYRDSASPLHRWEILLQQLDESEMAAVEAFFEGNAGALDSFVFTDPWDAVVYQDCSLETDGLDLTTTAEMSGNVRISVIENRG